MEKIKEKGKAEDQTIEISRKKQTRREKGRDWGPPETEGIVILGLGSSDTEKEGRNRAVMNTRKNQEKKDSSPRSSAGVHYIRRRPKREKQRTKADWEETEHVASSRGEKEKGGGGGSLCCETTGPRGP